MFLQPIYGSSKVTKIVPTEVSIWNEVTYFVIIFLPIQALQRCKLYLNGFVCMIGSRLSSNTFSRTYFQELCIISRNCLVRCSMLFPPFIPRGYIDICILIASIPFHITFSALDRLLSSFVIAINREQKHIDIYLASPVTEFYPVREVVVGENSLICTHNLYLYKTGSSYRILWKMARAINYHPFPFTGLSGIFHRIFCKQNLNLAFIK